MSDIQSSVPPKLGGRAALEAAKKRQAARRATQKATATTVAKRPAPASEDRPNKRLQGGRIIGLGGLSDAGVEPYTSNFTRHNRRLQPCFTFTRVTFPDSRGTITFGSAFRQPKGAVAKVQVLPGNWGDPSVTLEMAVNKSGFNEDLVSEEDEISNLKMVWQPYIKTREAYQVQEFTYRPVSESEHLRHPSVEKQAKQAGKDSSILIYVKMITNSSQITSPYEAEYWRLLTRKGEAAARNMAICAGFMCKTDRDPNVTVEFWFRSGFSTSSWVSLIGNSFKRCVDECFPGQHHDQGLVRLSLPDNQGETQALQIQPVNSGEGARPEPTPFRPGDKVAKLVREGWPIMKAIDKVFGEVTGDNVEPEDQPEAAAQDAASVQPSTSPHETLGLEPKYKVAGTTQTSQKMAIEPKMTPVEAKPKSTPQQKAEFARQLNDKVDALMDEGWGPDEAIDAVWGKVQAEEKAQKSGQRITDYEKQGSETPKAPAAADLPLRIQPPGSRL